MRRRARTRAVVVTATRTLVEGVRAAGLKRLVVVGGAGSLEVAPGKQLVDTEGFPDAYKPVALAHRDALTFYRTLNDLDWTFFAPAALIAPGERTGVFRTGSDAQSSSSLSCPCLPFTPSQPRRGPTAPEAYGAALLTSKPPWRVCSDRARHARSQSVN